MPAGGYLLDRFVITLDSTNHVFDLAARAWLPFNALKYPIFFHEYSHYLQNISTLSGFSDFSTELDLWWLFRETVDRNTLGSAGSATLQVPRGNWISLYQALWQTSAGSVDPAQGPRPDIIQFTITNVQLNSICLPLPNGNAVRSNMLIHGTALDGSTGVGSAIDFKFGTTAITEGLAGLLQEQLKTKWGGGPTILPIFPYDMLRSVGAYIAQGIDDYSLAMLATLSLQSNNPAELLHGMLEGWAKDPDVPNRLTNIVQTVVPRTSQAIATILGTDIPRLRATFTGKGEIGKGVVIILDRFQDALTHRLQNPFFDIEAAFNQGPPDAALRRLVNRHEPCLLLQKGGHQAEDELIEFGPVANSDALSVLHCAFEFYFAHLAGPAFVDTAQAQHQPCPFFGCCNVSLRVHAPALCQTTPWESPAWSGWASAGRCWYARGVASSAT